MTTDQNDPFSSGVRRLKRWGRRLALTLLALGALGVVAFLLVRVETTRLWFAALGDGAVYSTQLRAELLLGLVTAVIAGGLGALAVVVVLRSSPAPWPREEDEQARGWRAWVEAHPRTARRLVLAVFTLVPAYRLGTRASGSWQQYLLWRHAAPWGTTDPTYHRDLSYYVEIYPWHRTVVSLLGSALTWAIVAAVVAAVVHGSLRLRGPGRRITRAVVGTTSALFAAWLVVRAGGYWLDRMALTTSNRGPVTGASYTDVHAVGPGRMALIVIAVLLALALAANVVLRRGRILAGAVALTVAASLLLGSAWPALVSHLKEQPSAATLDLPQISRNQKATSTAFGLGDVSVQQIADAGTGSRPSVSALTRQALDDTQLRVLDPNRLSPTFDVKQQLQAYYGFKNTLDVDRYDVGGRSRDVAIGVRELHADNVSRTSWANQHLVYTHGYGVVAAPTDSIDPGTGVPTFLDGGLPPEQQIEVTQPRVYFGQNSPSYSIVGGPADAKAVEFDHPAGAGSTDGTHTTYTGGGGVAVGSWWHRLLYAAQLHSPQILLSSGINTDSRILTVRDPRARVAAVAPWLTLDGDVYPVVVDGRIQWVVDGYTTSSTYPDAQQVDLHNATTSTLTAQGASVAQPHRSVDYMRNSVKATVDAYTGEVHLYSWDQTAHPDPLLTAWESVYPGLVEPQTAMPAGLVAHLRYPQDLFDVQRTLLTRYHVTDAADFYSGNDFWAVPTDPTVAATQQLNSASTTYTPPARTPSDPSVYQTLSADGSSPATFSLSSPLVTLNHHDLAGYLTVDSTPGPDYGKLTLLRFPSGGGVGSPAQVQNDIESTTRISEALTLQRGGNSKVVLGQLVAVPLQGRMLYVEPIYTQAQGGNSFPILRHVVAIYGDGDPAFTTGLDSAVRTAIASGERAAS